MKLIASIFLLLALSAAASAQSANGLSKIRYGNGLYKALQGCATQESPVEDYDCFMAYGYISGVGDSDANIRLPVDASWKQAYDIVEHYLANHPENRQLTSVVLIRAAFKEAGWWKN